jgi:predicted NAD-dependent protein-ADP-ribosyltransferase YbiA (DUF1768 family)
MSYISFTKVDLPYGWLGNMSPYPVEYCGKTWRTTEALFQALRFSDESIREIIRNEKSPMGAKLKAKSLMKLDPFKVCVTPLSEKDLDNMMMCLKLKLDQHPQLVKDLLKTGESKIYEDVTSRGKRGSNLFWGALKENGEWVGNNHLGKMWEKLRESYK